MVEAGCRTYLFCDQCGLLGVNHKKGAFSDPGVIEEVERHARLEENPHPHRVTLRETRGKVDLEVIGDEFVWPIFCNDPPSIPDNG